MVMSVNIQNQTTIFKNKQVQINMAKLIMNHTRLNCSLYKTAKYNQ